MPEQEVCDITVNCFSLGVALPQGSPQHQTDYDYSLLRKVGVIDFLYFDSIFKKEGEIDIKGSAYESSVNRTPV